MVNQRKLSSLFVVLTTFLLISPALLSAAIIVDPDGIGATDVTPSDPGNWTSDTFIYIGESETGQLLVNNADQIYSYYSYIGLNSGSTGIVTIDGTGSAWTNRYSYIGYNGNGTLNITRGGVVNSTSNSIGYQSGSTGTVNVDGIGSTLDSGSLQIGWTDAGTVNITNGGLVRVAYATNLLTHGMINFDGGTLDTVMLWGNDVALRGTGTISLHSIIADKPLVISCTDDLTQYYRTIDTLTDQNITVNLNIDGQGYLGAGETGTGSLTINNGMAVSSSSGSIGAQPDSNGTVTVSGIGSTWDSVAPIYVGEKGNGTLHIINGGSVSEGVFGNYVVEYLGRDTGSNGTVLVDGLGSTWENHSSLCVGFQGSGTLEITDGGLVSVFRTLTVDYDTDGNAFINMSTGGMLALFGEADDSIGDFLDLVKGTDAIRYWDDSTEDWANVTGATYGEDFTLNYLTEGDLAGYTVLTVGTVSVPEPSGLVLLLMGILLLTRCRRRR